MAPPLEKLPAERTAARGQQQAFIEAPEAAVRAGPVGWAALEKGRMEYGNPVSTM